MVVEEVVKVFAHLWKLDAVVAQLTVLCVAQDIELHEEEFLELEAELGSAKCIGGGWVVYVVHRLVVGHEVVLFYYVLWKRLGKRLLHQLEHVCREFCHTRGCEP